MPFRLKAPFVLALCLFGTVGVTSVQADINPAKLRDSKAAMTEFIALAKNSEKTGEAPRATDAKAKKLLDAIFDDADLVQTKNVSIDALKPISERMLTGVQLAIVYMLAGTGVTDLNQLESVAEGELKVNLNIIKFAPEMGRFYDFQLHLQTAIAEVLATKLATASRLELAKPNFQTGLGEIRSGGQRVVAGVIETLALNGLTDEWRRDRLPALTAAGSSMAKILEPAQKKELQDLARACADVMDDTAVKKALQDFAIAMGA